MPLHLPLLGLTLLLLAASILLPFARPQPAMRPAMAVATDTGDASASPFGSGAAVRNLLY